MNAQNHRTGRQKQQCFEEGVCHQMKDGHRISRCTQRDSHVAQLRQGRISHNTFDVVLNNSKKTHEQGCDTTNHHDETQCRIAQLKQRRHSRHHKNARSHHGGSMNQRRNWRRAFHRIRKPHVQRKLRRLAHGTNEQADADNRDQHPTRARKRQPNQAVCLGKGFAVVQGTRIRSNQSDTQNKTEVTDTVNQKSLHIRKDGTGLVEIKPNQQIRHQSHCFPAKKQLEHVVAHDQHQHSERKKRDVAEKTVVPVFFFHIANGVNVNH